MILDYKNGVFSVDAGYEGDERTAVYIIRDEGRAAIVETAHNRALASVMDALLVLGIPSANVDYIFVTHVHLDHAGGAGKFMELFKNAKLVVHPRGARHMAAPDKLIDSVEKVYGKEEALRLYGKLVPVQKERIIAAADGQIFCVGSRTVACTETAGHAKHHLIFHDLAANVIFAGDAFGISYPRMKTADGGRWAVPSTSPVQFEPEEMKVSVMKILCSDAEKVYLTHYGEVNNLRAVAEQLIREIDRSVAMTRCVCGDLDAIMEGLRGAYLCEGKISGWRESEDALLKLLELDIKLNAQGLQAWYNSTER